MKVLFVEGQKKAQVVFVFNTKVIEVIKSVKGWSFDLVQKKWYIPMTKVEELIEKFLKLEITSITFKSDDYKEQVAVDNEGGVKRKLQFDLESDSDDDKENKPPKWFTNDVTGKRPFVNNLNKEVSIEIKRNSNSLQVNLPIQFNAYKVLKDIKDIKWENQNTWIVPQSAIKEFTDTCYEHNIIIYYV